MILCPWVGIVGLLSPVSCNLTIDLVRYFISWSVVASLPEASHSDSYHYIFLVVNQPNQGNKCSNDSTLIIDSGATSHMSFNKNIFYDLKRVPPFNVIMGGNSCLKEFGRGCVTVLIPYQEEHSNESKKTDYFYQVWVSISFQLVSLLMDITLCQVWKKQVQFLKIVYFHRWRYPIQRSIFSKCLHLYKRKWSTCYIIDIPQPVATAAWRRSCGLHLRNGS